MLNYTFFIIGGLTILFIYHIFVYLGRRSDFCNLSFALLSLATANLHLSWIIFPRIGGLPACAEGILYITGQTFFMGSFIFFAYTFIKIKQFLHITILALSILALATVFSLIFYFITGNLEQAYWTAVFIELIMGIVFIPALIYKAIKLQLSADQRVKTGLIGGFIPFIAMIITGITGFILAWDKNQFLLAFSIPSAFLMLLFSYLLTATFNQEHKDLIALKNSLEEKVKERTAELELEKEAKTTLLVNFAHETKTPLTIISHFLDDYINRVPDDKHLKIIKSNIDKLKRDMLNFLDAEKFSRNQVVYYHEHVLNLSEIIEKKSIFFDKAARRKGITLEYRKTEALFIQADPAAIDSILNNLLENAVKFTQKNGTIEIFLHADEKEVNCTIRDSGIGIPAAKLETVFLPYYQITHPRGNTQGIGMGLYIVKKIVDTLEGKIRIDSTEGKGTAFTVTFRKFPGRGKAIPEHPFHPNPSEPVIMPETIPEADLTDNGFISGRKNILLVEDNSCLLLFLKTKLAARYNVFLAYNGTHALERLGAIPAPDLIISDIMMDNMDGYEFHDHLLHHERFRAVPFIYLTAKDTRDEKIKGLNRGAIDFISKPFSVEELEARIASLLNNCGKLKEAGALQIKERVLRAVEAPDTDHLELCFMNKIRELSFSKREAEVAGLVIKGMQDKEIASRLHISLKTVSTFIHRIYQKTKTHNRVEFLNYIQAARAI